MNRRLVALAAAFVLLVSAATPGMARVSPTGRRCGGRSGAVRACQPDRRIQGSPLLRPVPQLGQQPAHAARRRGDDHRRRHRRDGRGHDRRQRRRDRPHDHGPRRGLHVRRRVVRRGRRRPGDRSSRSDRCHDRRRGLHSPTVSFNGGAGRRSRRDGRQRAEGSRVRHRLQHRAPTIVQPTATVDVVDPAHLGRRAGQRDRRHVRPGVDGVVTVPFDATAADVEAASSPARSRDRHRLVAHRLRDRPGRDATARTSSSPPPRPSSRCSSSSRRRSPWAT